MIFKNVAELKSTADKNFFKEKIDIYMKIVMALVQKYEYQLPYVDESECTNEFIYMGILKQKEDISVLKDLLKSIVYKQLITAVSYAITYKNEIKTFVRQLNNDERLKEQKKEVNRNAFTVVDLFCGAGGFSLGFRQAGYKILLANDVDKLCIETYKYNHMEIPESKIMCADIRELSHDIEICVNENVDVVIGGPPCQGFSSANKHHRVIDDPRNELYKYFLVSISRLAPKIVIMENVKGMMKVAEQVVEDFEDITVDIYGQKQSYVVEYELLNSVDFSVAQSRERLIYIAIRDDVSINLNITPKDIFKTISNTNKNKKMHLLRDALEGVRELTPPHIMNISEIDTEEGGRKVEINSYKGNENSYLRLINQNRTIPLIFNHKARYCSLLNCEIYGKMAQGDDATSECIADIMPYAHRNDKFKDKYYRLYEDKPCRTITAHLRSDCHSHIHPTQARTLTPREAARVQSFPDDYLFLGPYLKTYIQIGNAVPVVMARGIAEVIRDFLQQTGDGNENI